MSTITNSTPYAFPTGSMSPNQLAWLTGFLSGLISGAANQQASRTTVEPQEEFPWHDPSLEIDDRMKLAEGKSPPRQLMAAMAQLDCGTCGYLCKTYAEAIAQGSEKNLTKCTPGGVSTSKKIKQLVALFRNGKPINAGAATGATSIATGDVAVPSPNSGALRWSREFPFTACFKESIRLNAVGAAKDTRQIVIDLSAAGATMEYEPGDSLGVFPENDPRLVHAICQRLGAANDMMVLDPKGNRIMLGQALQRDWDVTKPTDALLELLIQSASNAAEADQLRAHLHDPDSTLLTDHDLLDLLQRFPSTRMEPEQLLGTLSAISPRLYSISSSLKAHPNQVHLTVGVVRYIQHGRERLGVASNFLADRLPAEGALRVFVQKSHGFHLPSDPGQPIIMIGPGTGIAPFRAFLEERQAIGARGENWLFFGDQHQATDFLYENELAVYRQQGLLTRMDTAFSRDQTQKIYVQHRLIEQGADIWRWIQNGANIYVCGDAKRMAKDVDQALREIVSQHAGKSAQQAADFIKELGKSGRYQRDVY